MAESSLSYKHSSLHESGRHFRVLELLPAQDQSTPIRCSLATYEIEREPSYEALSYTWGDEKASCHVIVDDRNFMIRPSLLSALSNLRHPTGSRLLWIDAICINQLNLEEKSSQVALMFEIFSRALRVVIWLGDATPSFEMAFRYVRDFSEKRDTPGIILEDDKFNTALPHLKTVFQHPWCRRMWTTQELVVATDETIMIAGHLELLWKQMENLLLRLVVEITIPIHRFAIPIATCKDIEPVGNMALLRTNWQSRVRRREDGDLSLLKLESLLIATSDRDASEPRDHVFAILGMLVKGQGTAVVPNYEESVSVVYQKATMEAAYSSVDFNFLMYACFHKTANQCSLPSWCVDFSSLNWGKRWSDHQTLMRRAFEHEKTGGFHGVDFDRQFQLRHDPAFGSLAVLGKKLGTILHTHDIALDIDGQFSDTPSAREYLYALNKEGQVDFVGQVSRLFDQIISHVLSIVIPAAGALLLRLEGAVATQLIRAGVVWKVFKGGSQLQDDEEEMLLSSLKSKAPHEELGSYYEVIMEFIMSYISGLYRQDTKIVTEDTRGDEHAKATEANDTQRSLGRYHSGTSTGLQIWQHILETGIKASGKAIFSADTGFIGRADVPVQSGDAVYILQRCLRTAILRPIDDCKFRLVGFAYTHDTFEVSETGISMRMQGDWITLY